MAVVGIILGLIMLNRALALLAWTIANWPIASMGVAVNLTLTAIIFWKERKGSNPILRGGFGPRASRIEASTAALCSASVQN
jgi:hypothetical protein